MSGDINEKKEKSTKAPVKANKEARSVDTKTGISSKKRKSSNKLICKGLAKNFNKYKALKPLDIEFEKGNIYGFFGPTGCGKSVMLKIFGGVMQPSDGEVHIFGLEPGVETKSFASYLPDASCFDVERSVGEIVGLYNEFFEDFDEDRALKIIKRMGVDLKEKFKNMSRSSQRRIEVVLVMSRRAEVYLLDEPIALVDPKTRDFVIKTIINNCGADSIVIISSKVITDIYKIVDEVMFMHRGEIKLKATLDEVRVEYGKEVDELYKEVFRC